jgi:hypothetical protein
MPRKTENYLHQTIQPEPSRKIKLTDNLQQSIEAISPAREFLHEYASHQLTTKIMNFRTLKINNLPS